MNTGSPHYATWEEEERDLRRREVLAQGSASVAQKRAAKFQFWAVMAAVISALLSTSVAAWAALVAQRAVKDAEYSSAQQADQNEVSTAINAMGSDQMGERIAGLVLLQRNAVGRVLSPLPIHGGVQEAYNTYAAALEVLGAYIHANSESSRGMQTTVGQKPFGPGYGVPGSGQVPLDDVYAADEVHVLLSMGSMVRSLDRSHSPTIDLSNSELFGQYWHGINFKWLSAAFMSRIDLRAADLDHSHWGKNAVLHDAYLQCADLRHADLRGAVLTGADLRGANVAGANFQGAKLSGTKLSGMAGTAKGLAPGLPASSWNKQTCETKHTFWDTPQTRNK